jgi:uncharacterized protein (TIGR00266 family)
MNVDIKYKPGCTYARIALEAGNHVTAKGGAMISMSGDMTMQTTTHKKKGGSVLKGIKRMLSGESFFMNHFTAGPNGGEVLLGTTLPGDMHEYELDNETLVLQSGSYVASSPDVNIDFGWQGFKTLFSGEKMFWLNISGKGKVIFNSFGAIYPVEIDGEYIVDTGHIVAFNETLDFTISKAGKSWMSSFLGGEGLVCKFNGKGTVWCQSHNPGSFGSALGPKLKPR